MSRATTPIAVAEPQHHHLPAWVRRAEAQARPILSDLLAALNGPRRQQFEEQLTQLTALISSGKFSQAFRYNELVTSGARLLDEQRREQAASARAQRVVDTARRRVAEQLRDAAPQLPQEVAARLGKALRAASDVAAISAVGAELEQSLSAARGVQERRREREIHRTRSRIERALPKSTNPAPAAEDWQDVLRRLQEQMSAGTPSS